MADNQTPNNLTPSLQSECHVSIDLSGVSVTDQSLVKDVCAVLSTACKVNAGSGPESIAVSCNAQVYFVTATFPRGAVVEVAKSDLDTITDVNPLRVTATSVFYDGERVHIKVRLCSYDHPITVTETSLVRVMKKRRWGMLGF